MRTQAWAIVAVAIAVVPAALEVVRRQSSRAEEAYAAGYLEGVRAMRRRSGRLHPKAANGQSLYAVPDLD